MSRAMVDTTVLKNAVELACRAPSLHNSQPWRWVAVGTVLDLFADPSRIGHFTDSTGREVIISCGAVLDHLRVAMAAAGWEASIERLPDPDNRDHLAAIQFDRSESVDEAQRVLAEAIRRRRTDRLAFAAPEPWEPVESVLRAAAATGSVDLDVIDDDGRPALADASRRTEQMRAHDSSYQAELLWWTGYSEPEEGIPPSALASDAEATRVDVARSFPRSGDEDRRADVDRDHSRIVVLSTYDDSRDNALRAGEVLSTLLLECTAAGLATCTLTHMMEVNASRELVRRLVGRVAEPQVLIRVGRAPESAAPPPRTPRRPLADVLQIR
ncbi:Acg family FMN-binding oxidoreductase [Mycobacterium sp.]|uniref:Acg family FMN-binding oxidoreductase n=1 Tax=Mycobacterium sp. TaxID=1785 RepID=UPI002C90C19B|nr:NAD(P)H nitroreductase [Mycobacterium sp.]HME46720.1 NAD(P)H nitroreductase [Mycobacterium sp.]